MAMLYLFRAKPFFFFNSPFCILKLQLKNTISDLPLAYQFRTFLNIISVLEISHKFNQAASV